jgi:hypothetical protein
MAQVIEWLPSKNKTLSSNHSTTKIKIKLRMYLFFRYEIIGIKIFT